MIAFQKRLRRASQIAKSNDPGIVKSADFVNSCLNLHVLAVIQLRRSLTVAEGQADTRVGARRQFQCELVAIFIEDWRLDDAPAQDQGLAGGGFDHRGRSRPVRHVHGDSRELEGEQAGDKCDAGGTAEGEDSQHSQQQTGQQRLAKVKPDQVREADAHGDGDQRRNQGVLHS